MFEKIIKYFKNNSDLGKMGNIKENQNISLLQSEIKNYIVKGKINLKSKYIVIRRTEYPPVRYGALVFHHKEICLTLESIDSKSVIRVWGSKSTKVIVNNQFLD